LLLSHSFTGVAVAVAAAAAAAAFASTCTCRCCCFCHFIHHFTASLAAAPERSFIRGEAAAAAFALNMCDETLFPSQKRGFNVFNEIIMLPLLRIYVL
jgi:hypothetical protein